jgi:fatty-acyl-CoA synthase
MPGWNFAEVWETAADAHPDAPAQIHDDRTVTWREFDSRADGVAAALLDAGAEHQDKVAQYLYNAPEYLESMFAAFKAGLAPVNTNYRYVDDELVYLWSNADVFAVAFHAAFTERIERVRPDVPVKLWLWVDDGTTDCPDWAVPYEQAADAASARVRAPWGRDGDDLLLLYTGGTTGMPKGVMWRQDSLIQAVSATQLPRLATVPPDYEALRAELVTPGLRLLPACPLMHGTGMFTAQLALSGAGAVVTVPSRGFDVEELLDEVQRHRVQALTIVGDAFAKPIVRALDAQPHRWDLSSLAIVTSSGVMWSQQTKQGLLRHHPGLLLIDAFSSSEALGMGQSISSAASSSDTARFSLGPTAKVIADDGHEVAPGSGEIGRVAVRGHTPVGYYKDPGKSAATFVVIDGDTYSMPGDYATVEADGSLTLLGRGSVCINTGGEKVFPEEVEEALKLHPFVHDAVAVGLPDDAFGEAVTAVVEPMPGAELDTAELTAHVKGRLAAYKAPRHVVAIDSIGRAPNAKVDYKRLRAYAADRLGIELER